MSTPRNRESHMVAYVQINASLHPKLILGYLKHVGVEWSENETALYNIPVILRDRTHSQVVFYIHENAFAFLSERAPKGYFTFHRAKM